jgi:hypothetical protein
LFVFDTTEWIACISERHLLFYHVDWSLRPLRMLERREAEVQVGEYFNREMNKKYF